MTPKLMTWDLQNCASSSQGGLKMLTVVFSLAYTQGTQATFDSTD